MWQLSLLLLRMLLLQELIWEVAYERFVLIIRINFRLDYSTYVLVVLNSVLIRQVELNTAFVLYTLVSAHKVTSWVGFPSLLTQVIASSVSHR